MTNIKDILNKEVIAGIGIGSIVVGMSNAAFIKEYGKYEYFGIQKILNISHWFPNQFTYNFFDSVKINMNVELGIVDKITLYNDFSGFYRKKIGIGSKAIELKNVREDIYFDDEYLIIGKDEELLFEVEEDIHGSILDNTFKDLIISSMTIRFPYWLSDKSYHQYKTSRVFKTVWEVLDES